MKKILFAICLAVAVSCVGKIDLPDHKYPPHLQGTEQEDDKDEGNKDENQGNENEGNQGETPGITPASGPEITVRFVSYNIGRFNKHQASLGRYSYPEVAAVLKEIDADVVGLNEVGKGQSGELAKELGKWSDYFAYAANTSYGNSIVASPDYKVVKEYPRVAIPKSFPSAPTESASEVRSLGVVEYEDFVFCVTHLAHDSNNARKEGAKIITNWAMENYGPGKTNKPVILLGDMNCLPSDVTIGIFLEDWALASAKELTFPCPNPTKCIDFVFVLKNGVDVKFGESHAVHSTTTTDITKASDHYPIYADITFKSQK